VSVTSSFALDGTLELQDARCEVAIDAGVLTVTAVGTACESRPADDLTFRTPHCEVPAGTWLLLFPWNDRTVAVSDTGWCSAH
jgi:hypothetical protein